MINKNDSFKLIKIFLAVKTEIGPNNVATGIVKQESPRPIKITKNGIEGDFQVDKRVHGGLEKAIYHYPYENYELLKKAFANNKKAITTVGENFSSVGLLESNVHIGDTFKVGSAILQASQPRMPCWKLNHHVGNAHVASFFIAEAATGWYYRVLEEGIAQQEDEIILIDRMQNSLAVKDIWSLWTNNRIKKITTGELENIPALSLEWKF